MLTKQIRHALVWVCIAFPAGISAKASIEQGALLHQHALILLSAAILLPKPADLYEQNTHTALELFLTWNLFCCFQSQFNAYS
jgi:hypothetical protein